MAENENSPQFDEHEYHLINVRIGICARSFAKYERLSLAKYRKAMYKFWHNGPPPPTAQQTEEAEIMVLSLIKSISVTVKELGKLYHEEWKATNMNPSVGFMIDINTRLIEEVVKKVDNLRGSQLYQRIDHKTNEECNKMVEDTLLITFAKPIKRNWRHSKKKEERKLKELKGRG